MFSIVGASVPDKCGLTRPKTFSSGVPFKKKKKKKLEAIEFCLKALSDRLEVCSTLIG